MKKSVPSNMDARRPSRTVPYPIIRQVGFFAHTAADSGQPDPISPCIPDMSPASNSLSPVLIPPTRLPSDNLPSEPVAVPLPSSPHRRNWTNESMPVGSYNPSQSLLGTSPPSSNAGDDFSEDTSSAWFQSNETASFSGGGGFDFAAVNNSDKLATAAAAAADNPTPVSVAKMPIAVTEAGTNVGGVAGVQNQPGPSSKPLKEKTTRAERRALQEAQRAAKGEADKSVGGPPGKSAKQPSQKKDVPQSSSAVTPDKKKDAPPPRMQFDDKSRVEKAKRRAVLKNMEARNRVELFRHLPQYEHGTQLPDLESKFFQLDSIHPAIHRVGLKYLTGDISGSNARCVAMLEAFQEVIKDYITPPEKTLPRDLTAKISNCVSFLSECRPLSISMGNAIRFLKKRTGNLDKLNLSESEAKTILCSEIDCFLHDKIVLADKVIVQHAATKIRDGDVLLTYGSPCVIEMLLLYAHELGKQFRVVIVDSRPKLEGQSLLRRLVEKGLMCTYTHINAVSYIMHEVTRVFLGAASVLSNGTVYSRVGTASVAMVAHAFHVPVLVCCEAYKFHERVQLDSICSNELGDPNSISKVSGREDSSYLGNWADKENLQLLNLTYDATPSDYISMIITDYGMVPPTSVAVIVQEYGQEHWWFRSTRLGYNN